METQKTNEAQLIDCIAKGVDNHEVARRDSNGVRIFTPTEIRYLEPFIATFKKLNEEKKARRSIADQNKKNIDITWPIYKKNIIATLKNFDNKIAEIKNEIQTLLSKKENARMQIERYSKLTSSRPVGNNKKIPNFFLILLATTIGLDLLGFFATWPIQEQALSLNEILERFFFLIGVLATSTILHGLYKKTGKSALKYCLIFTLIMSVVNIFHVVIFSLSDSIASPEQIQTIMSLDTSLTQPTANTPSLLHGIWASPGLAEFLLCVVATILGLVSLLHNSNDTRPATIEKRSYVEEQLDYWTNEYNNINKLIAAKEKEESIVESDKNDYKNGIRKRLDAEKERNQAEAEKDKDLEARYNNLYIEGSDAINNEYIPAYQKILNVFGLPAVEYADCTPADIQMFLVHKS